MSDRAPTPVEELDGIYRSYRDGSFGREEAIRRITGLLVPGRITRLGAEEILDHPKMPSQRYRNGLRFLLAEAKKLAEADIRKTARGDTGGNI